eukprot:g14944.t1
MRGRLKQKLQGPDGVLSWEWKHFQLEAGSLRVTDAGSVGCGGSSGARVPTVEVSLEGARYAVPWSGIYAFNGCGFDLVWASGRTWSLLCEDPLSRTLWVDALNLSIRSAENGAGGTDADIDAGTPRGSPLSPRELDSSQPPRPQNTTPGHTGRGWRDSGHHPDRALPAPRPAPNLYRADPYRIGADEHNSYLAQNGSRDIPRGGHHRHGPFGIEGYQLESSGGAKGASEEERRKAERLSCGERLPPKDGASSARVMTSSGAEPPQHQHRRQTPRVEQGRGRQRAEGDTTNGEASFGVATDQRDRYSSDASGPGNGACLSPSDLASSRGGGRDMSSTDNSVCLGGSEGVRRSGASQRSEELAKASAATWEQFQLLLERSRRSKDRFDRAVGGVAAAPMAETGHGGVRGNTRSTPAASPSQNGGSSCGLGSHLAAKDGTAAAVGFSTSQHDTLAASVSGSSTDRVSNATTPRSRAETEAGDAPRTAKGADFEAAHSDDGGDTGVDPGGREHEDSRLSAAVTDVETSLLPEDREQGPADQCEGDFELGPRLAAQCSSSSSSSSGGRGGGGSGSAGDGVRGRKSTEEGNRRRRRRRSCVLPPPPPPKTAAPPAHRRHRQNAIVVDEREGDNAAAGAFLAGRVQQLEADLEVAHRQADAAAQTEISLRRQLAAATTGRDGNEAESRRLKEELAAVKAALAEQEERGREAANARTILEQEGERQRAAAEEARSCGEARLVEALAEAAKAEREKAEYARQKQELEKAFAAEIGERQRLSSLVDARSRSESLSREKERVGASAAEGDLKALLASARSELEAVSLERDALAEELDRCITRLGDQAREVAAALRSRQQREIAEISTRCEVEKEALREKLMLESEERTREDIKSALAAQERRIRGEAAAKAAKDAKQRDRQLQEVRAEAETAGEATRKDIEKLRGLHARRVRRLEALLKEEGENLADARREIAACKANLANDAGEFQRWMEEQRDQSNSLLKELAVIQRKVDKAVAAEGEARQREGLAMGRLRKVMEEARLERAEGAEVKRQLRQALAELESDRSSQARRARNHLQLKRTAEIAQQEVAMVEAERARWHQERLSMEKALERLTRLVYGTAKNNSNSNSRNNKCSNSRAIPTAAPTSGAGKNTPATYRWKPPGGVGHDGRAPCSPIGVNVL